MTYERRRITEMRKADYKRRQRIDGAMLQLHIVSEFHRFWWASSFLPRPFRHLPDGVTGLGLGMADSNFGLHAIRWNRRHHGQDEAI